MSRVFAIVARFACIFVSIDTASFDVTNMNYLCCVILNSRNLLVSVKNFIFMIKVIVFRSHIESEALRCLARTRISHDKLAHRILSRM